MSHTPDVASELPAVSVKPLGGLRGRGRIALRPSSTLVTLIGGLDLDLTGAVVPPSGARLTKVSLIGGAHVVTGPDVRVEVSGFSLVGRRHVERRRDLPPTAPVLKISAWSLVGGVRVQVGA